MRDPINISMFISGMGVGRALWKQALTMQQGFQRCYDVMVIPLQGTIATRKAKV